VYIQDTWTRKKLTLQGALRYDRASSFSPAKHNGTTLTSRFNANPITLDRTDGVNAYNDISPRFGVAYDLFGDGKTAIKLNMGRHLAPATNDTIYTQNNPANRFVTNVSRSWTDTNGNYVVDCDLNDPNAQTLPNGDMCPWTSHFRPRLRWALGGDRDADGQTDSESDR
jgi:TonB-dependent receptor-like protein